MSSSLITDTVPGASFTESGVWDVPGREDAAPVFETYADHLRAEVVAQPQLVGDGGGEHHRWGVLPDFADGTADGSIAGVGGDVSVFFPLWIPPVIADHAVHRGGSSGVNGRMAGPCVGRGVVKMGLFAGETLAQQSLEAAGAIARLVAVEVVVAHLIHNDTDDELRAGWGRGRL